MNVIFTIRSLQLTTFSVFLSVDIVKLISDSKSVIFISSSSCVSTVAIAMFMSLLLRELLHGLRFLKNSGRHLLSVRRNLIGYGEISTFSGQKSSTVQPKNNTRARSGTRSSCAARTRKTLQEVEMSCFYGLPATTFKTQEVEILTARSRKKLKIQRQEAARI